MPLDLFFDTISLEINYDKLPCLKNYMLLLLKQDQYMFDYKTCLLHK